MRASKPPARWCCGCGGARTSQVGLDARDAKSALQEWAQARGMPPPSYVEASRSGADHAPVFTVAVRLASGEEEQAQAGSKRQAELQAARALLARMEGAAGDD